jgi:hypothetical protein
MCLPRPLIYDYENSLNLFYACPARVDQLSVPWITQGEQEDLGRRASERSELNEVRIEGDQRVAVVFGVLPDGPVALQSWNVRDVPGKTWSKTRTKRYEMFSSSRSFT